MSRSDRNHRYALIALGLLFATIVLLALVEGWTRYTIYKEQGSQQHEQVHPSNQTDILGAVTSAQDFDPWADPFPQWLMAIFSVVATGASIYAVCLLHGTLSATRYIVRDTRRAARAAVRSTDATLIAANAAKESNDLARQQFQASNKPWISVEMRGPFIPMEQENYIRGFGDGEMQRHVPVQASTVIHCIGDIPVTIEGFALSLMEGPDWPYVQNPPDGFGANVADFFTVLPSKESIAVDPRLGLVDQMEGHRMPFNFIMLTPDNRTDFMMRPPPIVGQVIYSDPFGQQYRHMFAFVASPTWGSTFKRYGGRRLNREEAIEQ